MSDGRVHFYESPDEVFQLAQSVVTPSERVKFVPRHPKEHAYPESERLLDDGFLHVIGHFGSEALAAQAARTSTDRSTVQTTAAKDRDLTDRLIWEHHTSPFEMVSITWHVRAPLFVLTQWLRHRASKFAHVNMLSGRYAQMQESFLQIEPSEWRKQVSHNKQMTVAMDSSDISLETSMDLSNQMSALYASAWECYRKLLDQGISREQARIVLPYAAYSEMWWQCDLHNLSHFLKLRTAPDAQQEIRVYANRMLEDVRALFPNIVASWENHIFEALTFSRDELAWLKQYLSNQSAEPLGGLMNASRAAAFRAKLTRLGLEDVI